MPLYEYQCSACEHKEERVVSVVKRNDNLVCCECGGQARRIISSNVVRNEPVWLPSALQNLANDAKEKVTDRCSFKKYLKEKGLTQTG